MIAFFLSFLLSTNPFIDSDEQAIRQRMEQQISCWDAGDFDCFMEPYWNSDSLVFVGSGGLTYGWTQTLANYKKRYPDQDHRGELTFDIKQVKRSIRRILLRHRHLAFISKCRRCRRTLYVTLAKGQRRVVYNC